MLTIKRLINRAADAVGSATIRVSNFFSDWLLMVVVCVAFILVLSIMGNKSAWGQQYPEQDRWGYVYPKECQRDLSFMKDKVPIYYQSLVGWATRGRYAGFFRLPANGEGAKIFIEQDFKYSALLPEIIHHELCHAYMYFKYGNAAWHPE